MLTAAETLVRVAGALVYALSLLAGVGGAVAGRRHAQGRASGMAVDLRADLTYAIVAVPYFSACVALWRPLPFTPGTAVRWVLLALGSLLGITGATAYLWGRRTLGGMYNVSSAFGSELFADHRLVRTGPYRFVRHPMYVGLFASALGALCVYRTWTPVFMVACLPGAVLKARREDRLLAAEFGDEFRAYRQEVPGWWPRGTAHQSEPAAEEVLR